MSPFDNLDRLFSLVEKIKQLDPLIADVKEIVGDVGKLIEDVQAMIAQDAEPVTVGAPRTHRLFRNFVHNRVVAGAARKFDKSRDEVEAVYAEKVTQAELAAVCAEVGVAPPMVGGSFTDWLQNVDWSKVFAIITKLIALIGPFLI